MSKQNLFYPSKNKILLSLLVFVLIYNISPYYNEGIKYIAGGLGEEHEAIANVYGFPAFYYATPTGDFPSPSDFHYDWFYFFVNVVESYVLGCLLIFFYTRFRK